MTYFIQLSTHPFALLVLALVATYLFSIRLYPALIYLAHNKNLMDEPGERSSHTRRTPTFGGVGLFISFSLVLILFSVFLRLPQGQLINVLTILGATILLLFLGLKDDLSEMSARKKFIGQFIASLLVIFASDTRILSMEGILGLGVLSYWSSVFFTLFVFVLVINAYNLIDGIDGLAGGIAVVVSGFFGVYYMLNDYLFMSLVSFVLIGAQCGFLEHNLSKTQKLFMGDSGSLFTGFLLAYQIVSFLNFNLYSNLDYRFENAPIIALAVISYPLFDTFRVFAVRIYNGKSPFSADKNHIHHRWLVKGLSHRAASFVIVLSNILVVVLAIMIKNFNIHLQLALCIILVVLSFLLPFFIKKYDSENQYLPLKSNKTSISDK